MVSQKVSQKVSTRKHLVSPNLPRGACRDARSGHAAALVRKGLGRERMRAWFEACGPFLNEKPSRSAGDCHGPLQNKQTIAVTGARYGESGERGVEPGGTCLSKGFTTRAPPA